MHLGKSILYIIAYLGCTEAHLSITHTSFYIFTVDSNQLGELQEVYPYIGSWFRGPDTHF